MAAEPRWNRGDQSRRPGGAGKDIFLSRDGTSASGRIPSLPRPKGNVAKGSRAVVGRRRGECFRRADSAPTRVGSGRTAVRAKAAIPYRGRDRVAARRTLPTLHARVLSDQAVSATRARCGRMKIVIARSAATKQSRERGCPTIAGLLRFARNNGGGSIQSQHTLGRVDEFSPVDELSLQFVMVAVAAGGREGSARCAPDRASRETGS